MRGTIRRRGDAWTLQVELPRSADGRRRYLTKTVHTPATRQGRKDAERALARLVLEAEAARPGVSGDDMTVAALAVRWLATREPDWSPSTTAEHRRIVDRAVLPALGDTLIGRVTGADLDAVYARWRRDVSGSTVRRRHTVLHSMFAQAVRWGLLAANPADQVVPPRANDTEVDAADPAEVMQVLAVADERDPQLALLLRLGAVTGARRSNLLGLRWRDVDLDGGAVTFCRAVVKGPDGTEIVERTKGLARYTVPISDATVAVLRRARAADVERSMAVGVRGVDDWLLFRRGIGAGQEPLTPTAVSKRWERLCRDVLGHTVRLHALRHGVATQLLAAGVDVRTVAGRMGHANPSMTLAVYGHAVTEAERRAADVMDGIYGG